MFANPVSDLHMIGVGVLGETGRFRLLGREETLLTFGNLIEPTLRIPVIPHDTILQFKSGFVQMPDRTVNRTRIPIKDGIESVLCLEA